MNTAARETLKKFIEAYRDMPCLWDPDNHYYTFKPRRLEALKELVEIYKDIDKEADVTTVRKKLNTIRTVYSKEKRRVERLGNGRSSLWYFDMLSFLKSIRPKINTKPANLKRTSTSGQKAPKMVPNMPSDDDDGPIKFEVETLDSESDDDGEYNQDSNQLYESEIEEPLDIIRTRKSPGAIFFHEDAQIKSSTSRVCEIKTETDQFDSFANIIAIELRSLKHPQQTIAQKLISDVIFYSKLGSLSPESTISNLNSAGSSNN